MLNLLFADGGATVGIIMSVVAAVIIHTHRFGNALQKMSVGQNHGYIRLRLGENKGREKAFLAVYARRRAPGVAFFPKFQLHGPHPHFHKRGSQKRAVQAEYTY